MLETVKPSSNSIGTGPTGATGPQGPTGPGIATAVVPVTSAELLGLAVPKVLVAAQGLGTVLEPLDTVFLFTAGGIAYVVTGGLLLAVGLQAGSGQEGLTSVATEGFMDGLTSKLVSASSGGFRPDLIASAENQPIVLSVLFGGAPLLGNGTMRISQTYRIIVV